MTNDINSTKTLVIKIYWFAKNNNEVESNGNRSNHMFWRKDVNWSLTTGHW